MANNSSSQAAEQDFWSVNKILGEKKTQYRVDWEGVDENGNRWPASWVLKSDVTEDLVEAWEEEKRLKKERKKNRKAGSRARKTSSVRGTSNLKRTTRTTSVTSSRTPISTHDSARSPPAQSPAPPTSDDNPTLTKKRRVSRAFPETTDAQSDESASEEEQPAPAKKQKLVRGPRSVQTKAQRDSENGASSKSSSKSNSVATKSTLSSSKVAATNPTSLTNQAASSSKPAPSGGVAKSRSSKSFRIHSAEANNDKKQKPKRPTAPRNEEEDEEDEEVPTSPVARSTHQPSHRPNRQDEESELVDTNPPSMQDIDDISDYVNEPPASPVRTKPKPKFRSHGSSQPAPSDSRSKPADDSIGTIISDSQSQSKQLSFKTSPAPKITTKSANLPPLDSDSDEAALPALTHASKPRNSPPSDDSNEETDAIASQLLPQTTTKSMSLKRMDGRKAASLPGL